MMLQAVCNHFNLLDIQSCQPIASGLINNSYKIILNNSASFFLQKINTSVFKNPLAIQHNYLLIQNHLLQEGSMALPKLIKTVNGDVYYDNNGEIWRCFEFFKNTYSPQIVSTPEKAYEVANCYGGFTAALYNIDIHRLETVLPNFHNLEFRYEQYLQALQNASTQRKQDAKELIARIEQYTGLVTWYTSISKNLAAFPLRIMHHDCKIGNILFDKDTDAIRCPIDLDTTQPGLYFSDIGDMIRTIVPNLHEDDTNLQALTIRPAFLHAITEGYLDAMADFLTSDEKENLQYAGSILIYMQALRFLTDYLNGNIYYKTAYPEQNKDRTANQLLLLDLLHQYTSKKA